MEPGRRRESDGVLQRGSVSLPALLARHVSMTQPPARRRGSTELARSAGLSVCLSIPQSRARPQRSPPPPVRGCFHSVSTQYLLFVQRCQNKRKSLLNIVTRLFSFSGYARKITPHPHTRTHTQTLAILIFSVQLQRKTCSSSAADEAPFQP